MKLEKVLNRNDLIVLLYGPYSPGGRSVGIAPLVPLHGYDLGQENFGDPDFRKHLTFSDDFKTWGYKDWKGNTTGYKRDENYPESETRCTQGVIGVYDQRNFGDMERLVKILFKH